MALKLSVGFVNVNAILFTKGVEELGVVALVETVHDLDRTLFDAKIGINHPLEIDRIADTQSVTGGACSLGRVE